MVLTIRTPSLAPSLACVCWMTSPGAVFWASRRLAYIHTLEMPSKAGLGEGLFGSPVNLLGHSLPSSWGTGGPTDLIKG